MARGLCVCVWNFLNYNFPIMGQEERTEDAFWAKSKAIKHLNFPP